MPVTATCNLTRTGGTVNSSGGFTPGCALGPATVTAQANGKTATVNLTGVAGAPSSLDVTPASASVEVKKTQAFQAVVKDSCNNTLSTPVTWTTANGKGTVTASGVYTAPCGAGLQSAALTAAAGTLTKSVDVTVTAGPLASLSLQPQNPSIPSGGTQQFSANGADSCGNAVAANATFSALPAAGAMTPNGLLTASVTAGSYPNAVTAQSGGVSVSTGITITTGAVSSLTLNKTMVTLTPNAKHVFTAEVKDSGGNVVTAPIRWSVVNGGGTINAAGEFTAGTKAGNF